MGLDDPIVWALIAVVIVFLFGASRIPQLARAFGQARKEFTDASRGTSTTESSGDDPLIVAAQREGIDTTGKTRDQIASEISWKLNKK